MPDLVPRSNQWYGWKPDLPDHRDRALRVVAPKKLPKAVHLHERAAFQFPIYDQGSLGSCTANAIGAAFEYELRRQKLADFTPSRLAIYYGERQIEGTVHSDAGAMIRDGMKVIAKQGAAPETLWPYNIARFTSSPPAGYFQTALSRQCVSYESVEQTEQGIKTALAAGYPIVFGISVFQSFESDAVAKTGHVPMPAKNEPMLGGHAILMTGYAAKSVTFRNSWGADWGRHGYATLPLAYVLDAGLADDFWIVKLIES